jgi:hypothetical protein
MSENGATYLESILAGVRPVLYPEPSVDPHLHKRRFDRGSPSARIVFGSEYPDMALSARGGPIDALPPGHLIEHAT